jgi:hypothetical protein
MRNFILGLSIITAACTDVEPGVTLDELEGRPSDGKADDWWPCAGMERRFHTLEGLAGSYLRSLPYAKGEITSVTLSPAPAGVGTYTGFAKRTSFGVTAESGRFFAGTDNPAIGAAMAFDRYPLATEGYFDEIYWVAGSRRDFTGKVQALCLGKAADASGNNGGSEWFALTRVGL